MENDHCKEYTRDENIITAFRSNNSLAQSRVMRCLVEKYEKQFLNQVYFKNRVLSKSIIESIAAEAFSESLNDALQSVRQEKYQVEKGSFAGYFYRIYHRRFFKRVTEVIKNTGMDDAGVLNSTAYSDKNNAFAGNYADGFSDGVVDILKKLSFQCKDYLLWHYIEGLSIAEISAVTGNKGDAVKAQLWRCRDYFKGHWLKS